MRWSAGLAAQCDKIKYGNKKEKKKVKKQKLLPLKFTKGLNQGLCKNFSVKKGKQQVKLVVKIFM